MTVSLWRVFIGKKSEYGEEEPLRVACIVDLPCGTVMRSAAKPSRGSDATRLAPLPPVTSSPATSSSVARGTAPPAPVLPAQRRLPRLRSRLAERSCSCPTAESPALLLPPPPPPSCPTLPPAPCSPPRHACPLTSLVLPSPPPWHEPSPPAPLGSPRPLPFLSKLLLLTPPAAPAPDKPLFLSAVLCPPACVRRWGGGRLRVLGRRRPASPTGAAGSGWWCRDRAARDRVAVGGGFMGWRHLLVYRHLRSTRSASSWILAISVCCRCVAAVR